ncbi:ABC transporter substrate-binding protein [Candidatus Bandiella euplotis]|uniref:Putrescine-binding periplasmic protein n=1 Tax=Candidatus Bandiella euplotis TaxID=1664265 RepID=A0ABZ0UNX9_9RICK|nr:spermidine/putrescine ABC transporter substrate-binding protein [Candidatus Bandiella woodruffii]WPX96403.1 ABC transporter substrate-binding protein [Candidatus Bandiella woodruffii]
MIRMLFLIIVLSFTSVKAYSSSSNHLYIYTWSNIIPDEVVQKFTKETGIKVLMSFYENNETMYAKIKLLGNQSSYDIVFPSSYFIQKMAKYRLLEELDKSKIPNFQFINKDVLNLSFDPANKFSIPYSMSLTGILYNKKYIQEKIDSWHNLFEPQYKRKILLIDDIREVFHIGLNLLGYNVNSINETEIKAAYQKLRTLLPNVKLFLSDSMKSSFLSEEVIIGMSWNIDAYQSIIEDNNLQFIYPKEGAIFSMDTMVILKNAKNKENAYKFINFVQRPDVAKEIIENLGLSMPNSAAKKLVNPMLQNNEVMFPNEKTIRNSIIHDDLEENIAIYNKYWEMLKVEN